MPESLAHCLHVYALQKHQRGGRVAQIVKADHLQSCALEKRTEVTPEECNTVEWAARLGFTGKIPAHVLGAARARWGM